MMNIHLFDLNFSQEIIEQSSYSDELSKEKGRDLAPKHIGMRIKQWRKSTLLLREEEEKLET